MQMARVASAEASLSRRKRQPKEETRRILLDAGVRMLFDRGLKGGAEHISLQEVFETVEAETGRRITGASVYKRIWETQSDYHIDLLLRAASHYPAGEEEPVREAARGVLREADLSTQNARALALREVCRVAGAKHVEVLNRSRYWQIWLAIWAITVSTPQLADDVILGPAIAEGHEKATAAFLAVFVEVIDELNYKIREPYTMQQFAVAVCAFAEGLTLKHRFSSDDPAPTRSTTTRATGPAGTNQPWTLFAIGLESLTVAFLDPKALVS